MLDRPLQPLRKRAARFDLPMLAHVLPRRRFDVLPEVLALAPVPGLLKERIEAGTLGLE